MPVLRTGHTQNNTLDLEIATAIANIYGFPINQRKFSITNKFSGLVSYTSWKTLCLGIYHPIYFPNFGPQSNIVSLGGAGAENHRHFYRYKDTYSFIHSNASKVEPSWLSYNVISEAQAEIKRMSSITSNIDPTILHYREYRNRMHSGRTPQYISLFNPLGSKLLDDVSALAGEARLKAGQINYDLMGTLLPSILEIPFDHESKSFNELRKNNLTRLNEWPEVEKGKVYIDCEQNDKLVEKTNSAFYFLNEDFQVAKKNAFVQDFFGKEFISKAEIYLLDAVDSGKLPHAIDGQSIAAIIAGGLFE